MPGILRRDPHARTAPRVVVVLLSAPLVLAPWAHANPGDPSVVHGSAEILQHGSTLQITNSPGAIIEWGSFSIAADELTRFQQLGADSAVLNRVLGDGASEILGQLTSNGRVFLINGNGIAFGAGAVIDTAGFVASTLDIDNADFLDGTLRFDGDDGRIVNHGLLTTRGGNVYFLAPEIENSGIVHAEDGSLTLAAGHSVRITSLDTPGVAFEVAAPDGELVNLGSILAEQGTVQAFAGTLRHSGDIRANAVSLGDDGMVVLHATGDVTLDAGSTVDASGASGGDVLVRSETGTVLASGVILADGTTAAGGRVRLLGEQVGLFDAAHVSADGQDGGGQILVGGNRTGNGPEPNARATFVGADTTLSASATGTGDGGEVIVFSEEVTRAFGHLAARGGPEGGDGGFIETSGDWIRVTRTPDAGAPAGDGGEWLIDPDLLVVTGNVQQDILESPAGVFTENGADPQIGDQVIEDAINVTNIDVTVQTAGQADAIRIQEQLDFSPSAPRSLTFDSSGIAGNIFVEAPIVTSGGSPLSLNFVYTGVLDIGASLGTDGGAIDLGAGSALDVTFQNGSPIVLEGTVDGITDGSGLVTLDSTDDVTIDGPASFDIVDINGGTLTLNQATDVFDLQLGNGTVLGTGAVTIAAGSFLWEGGTLGAGGDFLIDAVSTATITGTSNKNLRDRLLTNAGSMSWDDGNIVVSETGVLRNDNTFSIAIVGGAHQIDSGAGTPSFVNGASGSIFMDGADVTIDVPVDLQGTVDIDTGLMTLSRGGTLRATYTLNTTAGVDTEGLRFTGGTDFTLDNGLDIAGIGLTQFDASGDIVVAPAASVAVTNLQIGNGTLGGDGTLTVTSDLDWQSGALGRAGDTTGRLRVETTATGALTTTSTKFLRGGYLFELAGNVDWLDGNIAMSDTSRILVAGSNFRSNLGANRTLDFSSGTPLLEIDPDGSWEDISAAATVTVDVPLQNDGQITANGVDLSFTRGGAQDGAFLANGTSILGFGAVPGFAGHTFQNSTLSGTGVFRFQAGTGAQASVLAATSSYAVGETRVTGGEVRFDIAASTTDSLLLTNGTLGGAGQLDVSTSIDWQAGTMAGAGTTRLLGSGTGAWNGVSTKFIADSRTFLNLGTMNWNDGTISVGGSGTVRNDATLNIALTSNRTLDFGGGATNPSFLHFGSLSKTGVGTATIDIDSQISGTGTITDGTLDFTRGSTFDSGAAFTITAPGIVRVSGSAPHAFDDGPSFAGSGFLEIAADVFAGGDGNIGTTNVRLNSGRIAGDQTFIVATQLEWNAGTIGDTGTASTGTVQIDGVAVAQSTSTKFFEGDHDLLVNGNLQWTNGGFSMRDTSSITVASGGTFDTILPTNRTLDFGAGTPDLNIQAGGILQDTGTGLATIDVVTNVATGGTVTGSGAELLFSRGGTHDGAFSATVGSGLAFSDSAGLGHSFGANSTMTGVGQFRFTGAGTSSFGGINYDVGTTLVDSGTFSLNVAGTTDTLRMTGGSRIGAGDLLITDVFDWQAGTLGGIGGITDINASATGTISTGSTKFLDGTHTLSNSSPALVWSDGTIVMAGDSVFESLNIFEIQLTNNRTLDTSGVGAPTFSSVGQLRKSGAGTATIDVATDLSGLVSITDGTLAYTRDTTHGALYSVTAPGLARFGPGAHTLGATFSAGGDGFVELTSGTAITDATGATFTNLRLNGATLRGPGDVSVTDALAFESGILGAAGDAAILTIGAGAAGEFLTTSNKSIAGAWQLHNEGTLTWTDGSVILDDTARLQNSVGGVLDVDLVNGNRTLDFAGGATAPLFTNNGTLNKAASANTLTLDVDSNVGGSVNVSNGALNFTRGGSHASAYAIGAGAAVVYAGFTDHDWFPGLAFTGAGMVQLDSATTRINAPADIPVVNLLQTGGTLAGDGAVSISGVHRFESGSLGTVGVADALDVTIEATGTLEFDTTSNKSIAGDTLLLNLGTMNWLNGSIIARDDMTVVDNQGLFNVMVDGTRTFDLGNVAETPSFQNNGTLVVDTAGLAIIDVDAAIAGTVQIDNGRLSFSRTSAQNGTYAIAFGDLLTIDGGTHTSTGADFSGGGFLEVNAGTLSFAGTTPITHLRVNNGSVAGTAQLDIANAFEFIGGSLDQDIVVSLQAGGGATIDGAGNKTINDAAVFDNQGATLWQDGNIVLNGTSAISTAATGSFTVDLNGGPQAIQSFASGQFVNSGVFEAAATSDILTMALPFTNLGTVALRNANTRFQSGTTSASGGSWLLDTGNTTTFDTGFHLLDDATTFTGAGLLLALGQLTANAGTSTLNNVELDVGGELSGLGAFDVTGNFDWTGGRIGDAAGAIGGRVTLVPGATANLLSTNTKFVSNGTFEIGPSATAIWTAGNIQLTNGSQLLNAGDLLIRGDFSILDSDTTALVFDSIGTITKDTTTGTTSFFLPFDNNGLMRAQTGMISLNGDGTHLGDFVVTPPADITFDAGVHDIQGTFTTTGNQLFDGAVMTIAGDFTAGNVTITNASDITFDGAYDATNTTLNGFSSVTFNQAATTGTLNGTNGTISGPGLFTITNTAVLDDVTFSGMGGAVFGPGSSVTGSFATFAGPGTTTFAGTADLGFLSIQGGPVSIPGTVTASDVQIDSGTLDVAGDLAVDFLTTLTGFSGPGTVTVNDTFMWNGGVVEGTGLLDIAPGGRLVAPQGNPLVLQDRTLRNRSALGILLIDNPLTLDGTARLENQGQLRIEAAPDTFLTIDGTGSVINTGTVSAIGRVTLDPMTGQALDSPANIIFTTPFDNAGTVQLTQGFLRFRGGGTHTGTFDLPGDDLSVPGAPRLRFGGIHTLTPTSVLQGVSVGVDSGTTTIDGTVNVQSLFAVGGTADPGRLILNTDATVQSFALPDVDFTDANTPGFGGTGNLTVTDQFGWDSGTIQGSGSIEIANTADFVQFGPGDMTNPTVLTLDGARLRTSAPNVTIAQGSLVLTGGAMFENAGTLTLDSIFGTDNRIQGGTGGTFLNTGTLTVPNTLIAGTTLRNEGTLNAGAFDIATGNTFEDAGSVSVLGDLTVLGALDSIGNVQTNGLVIDQAGQARFGGNLMAAATSVDGGALVVDGSATIDLLRLNAGSAGGAGSIGVVDALEWNGGALAGTGTLGLGNGSSSTIGGPARTISGLTLRNLGDTTLQTDLGLADGATLDNGGLLTVDGDRTISGTAGTTFANVGDVSADTGLTLGVDTTTSGALAAPLLRVASGRTLAVTGGSFQVGDTLDVFGGFSSDMALMLPTLTAGSGAQIDLGAGLTAMNASIDGDLNVAGPTSVNGTLAVGGTGAFAATSGIAASTLQISAGGTVSGTGLDAQTAAVNGGLMLGTALFRVEDGLTVGGAGSIDASSELTTANLEIADGGTAALSGLSAMDATIDGGLLLGTGPFGVTNVLSVGSTGSVDASSALSTASLRIDAGGTVELAGLAAQNASTDGALRIDGGATDVSGLLAVGGTLNALAPVSAGSFQVLSGATADLAALSTGQAQIAGATMLAGAGDFGSLALTGGGLGGPGTATISNQLVWSGGGLGVSAATLGAGATGTISGGAKVITGTSLSNLGTLALATNLGLDVGALLANAGTLTAADGVVIAGPAATQGILDNSGTISGSGALSLGTTTTTSGTIESVSLAVLDTGSLSITDGAVAIEDTLDVAGTLFLLGGSLTAATTNVAGTFNGIGTVTGDLNNSGFLAPGTSPGALTIDGDFVQDAAGTLVIEVDGAATEPGVDFDVLDITGNATFDGALQFVTLENFAGELGGAFVPISFASSTGEFATIVQPPEGTLFIPTLGPNGLTTEVGLSVNPDGTVNVDADDPPVPQDREQAELIADAVARARDTTQEDIEGSEEVLELSNEQELIEEECSEKLDRPAASEEGSGTQGVGCRSL